MILSWFRQLWKPQLRGDWKQSVSVWVCLPMWATAHRDWFTQSNLYLCHAVTNAARQVCWQQAWMRRVHSDEAVISNQGCTSAQWLSPVFFLLPSLVFFHPVIVQVQTKLSQFCFVLFCSVSLIPFLFALIISSFAFCWALSICPLPCLCIISFRVNRFFSFIGLSLSLGFWSITLAGRQRSGTFLFSLW